MGRTRRELRSRVSSGHVVMVLAGALGVLLTLSVLRAADRTSPVLVAARDLPPGTVVDGAAVRVARVHAGASVLATLVPAEQLGALRGRVVSTVVHAGELLARTSLRPVGAHGAARVMSFAIPRARAVAGRLATGDRVDVLAVARDSHAAGYVLTDAEVVGVDTRGGGALAGGADDLTVSVVVDARSAPRLAAALDAGSVVLVRATGAPPAGDVPAYAGPTGGSR